MTEDGILAQDGTRTYSAQALRAEEMDDLEVSQNVSFFFKCLVKVLNFYNKVHIEDFGLHSNIKFKKMFVYF